MILTAEQRETVPVRYLAGENGYQIADSLGIDNSTVYDILKKAGVPARGVSECHRRYTLQHDFFSDIDSEESAYYLGWLAADGCVFGNAVLVTVSEKDRVLLDQFQRDIGSNHPIKLKSPTYCAPIASLFFRSSEMTSDLIRHGVPPAKSSTLCWPTIPSHLTRHFVRGYVDGDGCFCRCMNRKGKTDCYFSVVGTKQFLLPMQDFLMDSCGLSRTKLSDKKGGKVFGLHYAGGRQVLRIAEFLYGGARVFLPRKRNVMLY